MEAVAHELLSCPFMKKTHKKLSLDKTTLRSLQRPELDEARGALAPRTGNPLWGCAALTADQKSCINTCGCTTVTKGECNWTARQTCSVCLMCR